MAAYNANKDFIYLKEFALINARMIIIQIIKNVKNVQIKIVLYVKII